MNLVVDLSLILVLLNDNRYLQAYLTVRETLPEAHKLMGQIYEGLKDKYKAIESYKRCLDLEPDQKDVILKGSTIVIITYCYDHFSFLKWFNWSYFSRLFRLDFLCSNHINWS